MNKKKDSARIKKTQERKLITTLVFVIMILSVMLISISTQRFYVGIHNIDLGQNIRFTNAKFGINLVETSSGSAFFTGKIFMTGTEIYTLGMQQIKLSQIISVVGWLLFGLSGMYLYQNRRKT